MFLDFERRNITRIREGRFEEEEPEGSKRTSALLRRNSQEPPSKKQRKIVSLPKLELKGLPDDAFCVTDFEGDSCVVEISDGSHEYCVGRHKQHPCFGVRRDDCFFSWKYSGAKLNLVRDSKADVFHIIGKRYEVRDYFSSEDEWIEEKTLVEYISKYKVDMKNGNIFTWTSGRDSAFRYGLDFIFRRVKES